MKAPDSIVALEPRHFVYASSDRGSYGPHYREIPVRESVDSKEYTSDCVQSSEGCEARINSWICVLYAYPFRHIELRIIQKSILEAIRFILQQNKNTQSFHSNTVNMLYSFSLHSDVFLKKCFFSRFARCLLAGNFLYQYWSILSFQRSSSVRSMRFTPFFFVRFDLYSSGQQRNETERARTHKRRNMTHCMCNV